MNRPNKEITCRTELTYESNIKILNEFSKVLIEKVIEDEKGVFMGPKIGTLIVKGMNKLAVNRKATKELGKVVYYTNYETDGLTFKVMLYTKRKGFKPTIGNTYLSYFRVKPYDRFKVALSKAIKKGEWRKYYVV